MNGVGSPFPQPGPWQEHRTPDGRSYYYNAITKVTQWTKPEELMSPAEVCCFSLAFLSALLTLRPDPIVMAANLYSAASAGEPTVEGIHCRGWSEVLV